MRTSVNGFLLADIPLKGTFNRTPDKASPMMEPHYMILNLAVGGRAAGDDSKTKSSARFEVDWVRVYQMRDGL